MGAIPNPKIFSNKIPGIANPRRLSKIIILSGCMVGASSIVVGLVVMQFALVFVNGGENLLINIKK
jgi:hypothetical protein